jgi:metal-responsive CopG/Arc/MetJ family transcriptional regulator
MKVKTSITLSEDLLSQIDGLIEAPSSRSAFIEKVLRQFLRDLKESAAEARDLRRLNRHAEGLNAEAMDVREYQAPWPDE